MTMIHSTDQATTFLTLPNIRGTKPKRTTGHQTQEITSTEENHWEPNQREYFNREELKGQKPKRTTGIKAEVT